MRRRLRRLFELVSISPKALVANRHSRLLAYLLPVFVVLVATQTWFQAGTFVASGDVGPFVRTGVETSSIWGHDNTGAGSPTAEVVRLPELATLSASTALGFGEEAAQRIFYSLMTVATTIAVIWFVFGFTSHRIAAGVAGLLSFFNPYVMQSVLNPLPIWAIGVMALAGGFLVREANGARFSGPVVGLASLSACYLGLNPPLLVVALGWILCVASLGSILGDTDGWRRSFRLLARGLPWCVLINLWWVVPVVFSFVDANATEVFAAVTDIQSWKWTHARSSIANVTTLSSHWGWNRPEYFPYAQTLDAFPLTLLRYAFPVLAFLAPFITKGRRRRAATALSSVALVLILVGKGLHVPLAGFNSFLYETIPGMWLLREPATKISPIVVLLYVALTAMTIERLAGMDKTSHGSSVWLRAAATSTLLLSSFVYAFPLWTGLVIPDKRPLLPSAHVDVPDEWQSIANKIDASPKQGKVLLLPLNDYYQVPTDWGYYGVDVIPKSLLTKPVIQFQPETYFQEAPAFSSLVSGVQSALVRKDSEVIPPLLSSLGISHVVVRRDIDIQFPHRSFVPPKTLIEGLKRAPGVTRVDTTSVADVFEFPSSGGTLQTAEAVVRSSTREPSELNPAPLALPSNVVTTEDESIVTDGTTHVLNVDLPASEFRVAEGAYRVTKRALGQSSLVLVRSLDNGSGSLTSFTEADRLMIDNEHLGESGLAEVSLSRTVEAVRSGDHIQGLEQGRALMQGKAGSRLVLYGSEPEARTLGAMSGIGDCGRHDERSLSEVGIRAESLSVGSNIGVRLEARAHTACVSAPIKSFSKLSAYRVPVSLPNDTGQECAFASFRKA